MNRRWCHSVSLFLSVSLASVGSLHSALLGAHRHRDGAGARELTVQRVETLL